MSARYRDDDRAPIHANVNEKRETGSWGSIGIPNGNLDTEAVTPFPFRFGFLYMGKTVLLKYLKVQLDSDLKIILLDYEIVT